MANHRSVYALMRTVHEALLHSLPSDLSGRSVRLMSGKDIKDSNNNELGLYMHRMTIDPERCHRWFPPTEGRSGPPHWELPLDLHFLLMSWSVDAEIEIGLHAWAMSELAAKPELDPTVIAGLDTGWREQDRAYVLPESLTNEELFKIWDALPAKYTLSSAYVIKTARIELRDDVRGAPVRTRGFAYGSKA